MVFDLTPLTPPLKHIYGPLREVKKKRKKKKNILMDIVQLTWKPPLPPPNVDYVFFLTIVLSFFSNF